MLPKKPKPKSLTLPRPKPLAPRSPSTKSMDAQRKEAYKRHTLKYFREQEAGRATANTKSLKIPQSLKTAPSRDKPKAKKKKNNY
tara:strand:+ start:79 stop:333 length:255 start_codon:yes stop_codon:yes gene_type:complete